MYVMNKSGTDVRRISFGEGRYSQPVWSPRGDLIAFTVVRQRTFYIGVMSPDGTNERLITTGFLVEGPTWAPNGRVIMFSKKARDWSTKNFSIDLTGRNLQPFKSAHGASDPSWSALLSKIKLPPAPKEQAPAPTAAPAAPVPAR